MRCLGINQPASEETAASGEASDTSREATASEKFAAQKSAVTVTPARFDQKI